MAIPFLLSAATRLVTSQMAKKAAKEGVKKAAKKFVKGKKKDKVKSKGGALVKRGGQTTQAKTQQRVSYQKLLNTSKDVGSVDKIQQKTSYESLTKTMQGIVKTTTQLDKTLKKQLLVDKKKVDNKKKVTSIKKKKQREENLEKRRLNLGGIGSAAMGVANKFNIIDFFTNILLGGLILWMIKNVDKMKSAFKLLEKNSLLSFYIIRGGLQAITNALKFVIKAPFKLTATVGRSLAKVARTILKGIRSLGAAILKFARNKFNRIKGGKLPKPVPSRARFDPRTGRYYGKNVNPITGKQLRSGSSISRYNESYARKIQGKANIGDRSRLLFRDSQPKLDAAKERLSKLFPVVKDSKTGNLKPDTSKGLLSKLFGGFRGALGGAARFVVNKILAPVFAIMEFSGRKSEGQTDIQAGAGTAANWLGFKLGGAGAAKLLSPLLVTPIPGARVVYGLGVFAAAIAGAFSGAKIADALTGANADELSDNNTSTTSSNLSSTRLEGNERELLLKLMIAEAGGEGKLGMAAVARSVLNRAGLIQSGKVSPGTFNAKSGSIFDVISAPGQYQPYNNGLPSITEDERQRAIRALSMAENTAGLRGSLEGKMMSASDINNIMKSTGFRTPGAGYDRSQDINPTTLGGHVFNTAGNTGMVAPTASISQAQIAGSAVSRGGETTGTQKGDMISGFPVTSSYRSSNRPNHQGIDVGTPVGTFVALSVPVEIMYAGTSGDYGYVIDAWAPSLNLQFRLAHLKEFIVRKGQKVPAGTALGKTGGAKGDRGAGSSRGPHLHFEVDNKKNGTTYGGLGDPSPYVQYLILSSNGPRAGASVTTPGAVASSRARSISGSASYEQGGENTIFVPSQQQQQTVVAGGGSSPVLMAASTRDVVNSYYKQQLLGFLYKQG